MASSAATPRPLTDDEVSAEMKKMIAFIRQEAIEKARELQVKADEEFNIEKAKLVRNEELAIEAATERKMKQAEIKKKIAHSSMFNKCRLQTLQARDEALTKLHADTQARLCNLMQDEMRHQELLNKLILQAFLRFLDLKVVVKCLERDVEMVKKGIEWAAKEYSKMFQGSRTISATLSNEYLKSVSGGIVLSSPDGKITCSNTFESRMELAFEKMLPEIRTILYGPSSNRRFFD